MRKHFFFGLLVPVLLVLSCNSSKNLHRVSLAGETQGTYYAITYLDAKERNFQEQVDSILKAVDMSASLWIDNSIISRVNNGDSLVEADQIFIDNFNLSKEVSRLTDGYFDFTIGPLAQAWGFHRKGKMELTGAQVDSLHRLVNYNMVHLDGNIVKMDMKGMKFDFNAIAQGYTVDLLAKMLDEKGVKHFIIDVGGEIIARNRKPDGSNWRVGIEKPSENSNDERVLQEIIQLENKALATSGSYRKYFEKDGKRYSHAISPKTGYPVDHHLLSVTVLADNAAYADALATAFLVMGLENSKLYLSKLTQVEAYFIFWSEKNEYEVYLTDGMKQMTVK